MSNELTHLSEAFATYGVYSVVAGLTVAVVYLFKKINELNKDIQSILQSQIKDQADIMARCTKALEDSSKALENIQNYMINKGGSNG